MMNSQSKIELKNKNSNHSITNKLEKISNGNIPKTTYNNFKNLSKILMCAICMLVGICITPTLTQKPNKNVSVKYSNFDSQNANNKEKTVKNGSNKDDKQPNPKQLKPKKPKNKNKLSNSFKVNQPKNNNKLSNSFKANQPKNNNKLSNSFKANQPKNNNKLSNSFKANQPKNNNKLNKPISKNKLNNSFNLDNSMENTITENPNTGVTEINNSTYQNNIYGNFVSNVLNGNFLAEEDNWFYYINYNDSNYVYRTNILDGKTELVLHVSCKEINVLKGKVYAIPSEFNNELIIYDLQTKQYQNATINEDYLNLSCDYAISCDENGIYKTFISDTNNIGKEIYAGDIEKCVLYDQTIYFIESNNLYSVDLNGDNKNLIKENIQHFAISNSEIYYVSDNQLYSTDNEDPLFDILLSALNIYDNTIYFSNENDNGKLYSINITTSEIKKLSDEIAEKICVTKNKVAIITPECKIVFI